MSSDDPINVAIIGGGCAAMTAAFELTRPEQLGKYRVTVYQLGWRLGGKGASGRGPNGRIEEHGLHIWMGFYENAFRLMRDCYDELDRDASTCPITEWTHAFEPYPVVGFADRDQKGRWIKRTASFAPDGFWPDFLNPAPGLPGDGLDSNSPFTVRSYLMHTVELLRTLLLSVERTHPDDVATDDTQAGLRDRIEKLLNSDDDTDRDKVLELATKVFEFGMLATTAGLVSAVGLIEMVVRALPTYPQRFVETNLKLLATAIRRRLEALIDRDEELRFKWHIIDMVIAIIVGIVKEGLIYHPKGFDAINDRECLAWLIEHGASEESTGSGFVRALYDLAFAYGENGPEPGIAAGQAIRGALRMLFTFRGSMFWRMNAGMGDIVFAPLYEVLKNRGVRFEFFHRLENIGIADADADADGYGPYVERLEFSVQARIRGGGEYSPLINVNGLPCWPSRPDYDQLINGRKLKAEGRDFESDWETRKDATKTLRVKKDFDLVVLGVGVGAVPQICTEIIEHNDRWRTMVENVGTIETQAFQLWLRDDMESMGWSGKSAIVAGFVNPFNTWADMTHLTNRESWDTSPGTVAYFCNRLPENPNMQLSDPDYPARRRAEVRENAVRFLNRDVGTLWPNAVDDALDRFRWELLVTGNDASQHGDSEATGEQLFDSQFWVASVNRSDRYVLAAPNTLEYRISPLDYSYDNLTIAGDWTDCGFNEGCVEAAVMSGRLAAHAVTGNLPALESIVGYDHP